MRILLVFVVFVVSLMGPAFEATAATIRIDLPRQVMQVQSLEGEFEWPISSARRGYVTPVGYYHAQYLERMHYSRKYDNAPMPHSIFFRGGYAIHGTNSVAQLGRPASHGCIRLSPANAATLYSIVQREGARIEIVGSPVNSQYRAYASRKVLHHYALLHHHRRVIASTQRGSPMAYAPIRYSHHRDQNAVRRWQSNPALY